MQEIAKPAVDAAVWERQIEECLRKLDDFAFLGEHPLADLALVRAELRTLSGAVLR